MSTINDDQNNKTDKNLLNNLFFNTFIPLLLIIIGLLIEYKSGFFQTVDHGKKGIDYFYYAFYGIAFTVISFLFFAVNSFLCWLNQRMYLREQFSFYLLFASIFLTLLLILAFITNIMPWQLPIMVFDIFIKKTIFEIDTRAVDYAFLMTIYFVFIGFMHQMHLNWRGLKSVEQHKREQRSENVYYNEEGLNELIRLIKKQPPLSIYTSANSKLLVQQLEPVKDILNWKDLAKELIRLSSSSYAFDEDCAWHDKENCWVGRNVNTGELVFLYPYQEPVEESELKTILKYAERLALKENTGISEIIIALPHFAGNLIPTSSHINIRYETKDSLLDNLIDFKDYFNDIKRRVSINHLPDSEFTLRDVYVPSFYHFQNNGQESDNIEEYLNTWLDEPGQRQLALLGEYGQGKSTATLMWAFHLIESKYNNRIPILIELRGTSPRNLTPLQLLGAWASKYSINPQSLMHLLVGGKIILVFEGFDEMALVGDVEMRLKHFRTLWQFAYPNAKILITGRPNFFLDEEEMIAALGIRKPVADRPYCEALRLAPFNSEQIKLALRSYKEEIIGQIHSLIETNPRFYEIVSRPSLLHIVAVLWEREQLVEKVDQLTSAYVMDLFIRHSYRRQGLKESESPEFMALTSLEREYFMSGIAAYMASKRLPNQISGVQLNDIISELITAIPESISTDSTAISGETTRPLRIRLRETEYGVEHVKTDVRACGLLADDPAAPGTFRFGHKSFMEYLVASVIAERIQDNKSEKAAAIIKTSLLQIENILLLPVALDFLSELLVGIRVGNGIDDDIQDFSIAKKLFGSIVCKNIFEDFIYRPSIFVYVFIDALFRDKLVRYKGILRALYTTFPMTIIFLFSIIFILSKNKYIELITLFLAPITVLFTKSNLNAIKKISLWFHVCEKIGVRYSVLHAVIGTGFIRWLRDQPIDDYYNFFGINKDEKSTNPLSIKNLN